VRIVWPTVRSAFLLLALFTLSLTACDRGDHPTHIGQPAPAFTLTDADSDARTVSLAQLHGRIVIVNFWATWCFPCIDELPSLLALQRRMPQVTILAISQDKDAAAYNSFLLTYGVDLLTLRDPSMRIQTLYGTQKIPESYVIDRDGILRRKFVSAQDWTSPEILDYLSKL
jgi:cytochrome c biogenesis protein CcmG, thiol:disulfide interchange protein DsbE